MLENEIKTEIIKENYDYAFLFDILEMIRGTCCIVYTDKKLNRHFTALIDYLNSRIPDIEGEILDFDLTVTVKK